MPNDDFPAPLPIAAPISANPGAMGGLPGPAAPAAPPPAPVDLDGRAKAAIVVRLLLNEGADIPLEDLPESLQAKLTQQMGSMGLVDRATLGAVVHEFAEALDGVGLSFAGGMAGALSVLDGKISPQTAARLRREAGVRKSGNPWDRLKEEPVEVLAELAESESTEVAAVLLSKLDTRKAAALLNRLPGPVARRITYAVSQTVAVTPQAVDRIGLSLASQLDQRPPRAFTEGPGERVGAILNESAAATREEVLSGLDEKDAEFAERVRRNIFIFDHIGERVRALDVPGIARNLDQAVMVTALCAATAAGDKAAESAEFLLASMSARLADTLREEMAERGEVRAKDGEKAMNAVVAAIKTMARNGEIELVTPDEDDED